MKVITIQDVLQLEEKELIYPPGKRNFNNDIHNEKYLKLLLEYNKLNNTSYKNFFYIFDKNSFTKQKAFDILEDLEKDFGYMYYLDIPDEMVKTWRNINVREGIIPYIDTKWISKREYVCCFSEEWNKKKCIDIVRSALNNMEEYNLEGDFTDWCEGSAMLVHYIADKYMKIDKRKNRIIYGYFNQEAHVWNLINGEIYDATIDQFGSYDIYNSGAYSELYKKERTGEYENELMKIEQEWIDNILLRKQNIIE